MRNLLREAGASVFADLVGSGGALPPRADGEHPQIRGEQARAEDPEFLHDTIVPITRDTYGIIVYQEQVMEIAASSRATPSARRTCCAGAMGKKIKSEMAAQRESFVAGAVERGVARSRASHVFDLVDKFAGYGFNKAHSAGYALIAYQTAWLKANHPLEFLAASMSLERGNPDKLNVFPRRTRPPRHPPPSPPTSTLPESTSRWSATPRAPALSATRWRRFAMWAPAQ